jgi:hypothetical protein
LPSPELDVALFIDNLGVAVSGAGIDAKNVRVEVVNPNGVLVEVRFSVWPGISDTEAVEDVGEAIVLEVQRANGLAETGLQGMEVGSNPGLNLIEAMVALGSDEGEPDADDLSEGQLAFPAVPGGEVAIEDLGHLQPL